MNRDDYIEHLRAELVALNAKLDASKFCANVADDLRSELADAKETIMRYETTAENCDVLRAELANQLEVKAFWIGRTRALEVELAAIKEQGVVMQATDGGRNPRYEGLFDGETEEHRAFRLNSSPVSAGVMDERAAFEAAYLKANYPRVHSGELSAPPIFGQAGKGEYEDDDMQKCWVMWQARAMLAAIKAQEPVAWMLKNEKGRIEEILPYMPCASDMQPYWLEPFPLYAAPVAKQVVLPDALSLAFITCESVSDSYRVVIKSKTLEETQSIHNWIVRLNAADQEGDQDE